MGYVSIPWRVEYPKPNVCEVFSFLGGGRVEEQQQKNQGGVEITMEKQGDRNVGQKVVLRRSLQNKRKMVIVQG